MRVDNAYQPLSQNELVVRWKVSFPLMLIDGVLVESSVMGDHNQRL